MAVYGDAAAAANFAAAASTVAGVDTAATIATAPAAAALGYVVPAAAARRHLSLLCSFLRPSRCLFALLLLPLPSFLGLPPLLHLLLLLLLMLLLLPLLPPPPPLQPKLRLHLLPGYDGLCPCGDLCPLLC